MVNSSSVVSVCVGLFGWTWLVGALLFRVVLCLLADRLGGWWAGWLAGRWIAG